MSDRDTILWLIRHPEPEASFEGRCYGWTDVPLSPRGIEQAESLASTFADEQLDAIYSSPSERCVETASRIAAARSGEVQRIDALREIHFGDFEGRSYDEIAARHPAVYKTWMDDPTGVQFPGGESYRQMSERVMSATCELLARHCGEGIMFVTHGGPIRIILADALGLEARNIFRIGQRYGAINCIRYRGAFPVVEVMNGDTSALCIG